MRIADKRRAADLLGRGGISERIIELAEDISKGSYKNAIIKGGQISVLIDACSFDCYWHSKANQGKIHECDVLQNIINNTKNESD